MGKIDRIYLLNQIICSGISYSDHIFWYSKKDGAFCTAKRPGVNITDYKCISKDRDTLAGIIKFFKGTEMFDQYYVDGCSIYLYFSAYTLAVECDEFGNDDKVSEYEPKRQI